jgi:hypothetical protein
MFEAMRDASRIRPRALVRREDDEQLPRAQTHAAVLALQRTAGNAAVAAWLRSRTDAVLARDRKLPADAKTLQDVASAAKAITIDTDTLTIGPLKDWLTASRGDDRDGIAVDIRFPGPMAGPKAKTDDEKKIRTALSAMGMSFFNLRAGSKKAAQLDVMRFADLDLTPYGGVEGHYRFTCVTRTPKKGKKDAQVDLIIELVRSARPAFKAWKDLEKDRKAALEARFAKFGFTKAESDLSGRVVDTWLDDSWGKVLQALELIPEATLAAVPNIEWVRGHGKAGPTGEGGYFEYNPNKKTRTLTLYDGAFASDEELVELIAHEIGHALSSKPPSEKRGSSVASSKAFQDALKADGKPITTYKATDVEEQYAEAYSMFIAEPETMKVLRPKLFEFFTKNREGAPPPKAKTKTPAKAGAK